MISLKSPYTTMNIWQDLRYACRWGTLPLNLYGAKTPERVEGIYVTPNFFRTLGVQPEPGRDFAEVRSD